MLKWQQAEGQRHALDVDPCSMPRPDEPFRALCGALVTPEREDFVEPAGKWLDPTCWDCDRVWREMAHFPAGEIPARPDPPPLPDG